MRVRFDKNAEQALQESDIYIKEAKAKKGKWNELFEWKNFCCFG